MSQHQPADGPDLSTRELVGLLRRARNGDVSGEEVRQLWESIPPEQKYDLVRAIIDAYVVPYVEDVKQRVREDRAEGRTAEAVREQYADMDADAQQETFDEVLDDLVSLAFALREHPGEGADELKARLRDPFTVEALLLVFENDEYIEYIEPWYRAEMKAFAAQRLRWLGMALVPEMYEQHEVRETYEQFGLDVDALERTAERHGQGEGGG